MARDLKELIEEWEFRADSSEAYKRDRITAIEECIDDLKSTMLVMEAEEVARS